MRSRDHALNYKIYTENEDNEKNEITIFDAEKNDHKIQNTLF